VLKAFDSLKPMVVQGVVVFFIIPSNFPVQQAGWKGPLHPLYLRLPRVY
jgi:hypothetical protein